MNHRKTGRILSRNRKGRRALLKTLLGSLVLHDRIETTSAKAKEMKTRIDRLVNQAKRVDLEDGGRQAVIRELRKTLPLVAVQKMVSTDFTSRFAGRSSGYTRVVKLEARKGDGAEMAIIEFVA